MSSKLRGNPQKKKIDALRKSFKSNFNLGKGSGSGFTTSQLKEDLKTVEGRQRILRAYEEVSKLLEEQKTLAESLEYSDSTKNKKDLVVKIEELAKALKDPSSSEGFIKRRIDAVASNSLVKLNTDQIDYGPEEVVQASTAEIIPPEELKKMMEDAKEKERKKEIKSMAGEDKKPSTPKITAKVVTPKPKPEPPEAKPSLRGAETELEEKEETKEETKEEETKEESKEETKQETKEETKEETAPKQEGVKMTVEKPSKAEPTEIDKLQPLPSKSDLIPPERLGTRGKTAKELLNDIEYFFKNFSSQLTREKEFFKNVDKSNIDQLRELHNRIVGKLAPKEQKNKKIGIVIDADQYIREQLKKILQEQTFSSLRPADVVIDVGNKAAEGRNPDTKDFGDFAVKRTIDGGLAAQREAIYRYMPSENEMIQEETVKQPKKPIRLNMLNPRLNNKRTTAIRMNVDNPFRVPQKTIKLKYLY
jgi:hypothetical protein